MIIYIISAICILLYTIVFNVNKTNRRKKIFLCFSFGILFFIAAVRKYTVGTDLNIVYKPIFDVVKSTSWTELKNIKIEIGFIYFLKILSCISEDIQLVIFITSFIIYSAYAVFIYKNSEDVGLSTVLFILLNTYLMSMNIIRQELAIAIILYFFGFLKKKKYLIFSIIVFIATLFHSSALFFLILIPLGNIRVKKQYFIYSFIVIAIICIYIGPLVNSFSGILSIESNNKDYSTYLLNNRHGVGYINTSSISEFIVALLIYIIVAYYYVLLRKSCNNMNKKIDMYNENIEIFGTMLYFLFVTSTFKMNVISRLSYYFLPIVLIALPKAISKSIRRDNKRIIIYSIYGLLLIKYIFTVVILADTLYGVTPYRTFF